MNRRNFFKAITVFVAGLLFAPKVKEFSRAQWVCFDDEVGEWQFLVSDYHGGDDLRLYVNGKRVS